MSVFTNVLQSEDIAILHDLPEVLQAKSELTDVNRKVTFYITPTERIRNAISTQLGLSLTDVDKIPMRWIVGDTASHIDTATSKFSNTYLIFLNDSPGELVLDNTSYPITQNTAFVFNEGIVHQTINTGGVPRLLLGPMNELGQPVGNAPGILYYANMSDALSYYNSIAQTYTYILGNVDIGSIAGYPGAGYGWRIASNSTPGLSTGLFANGVTLTSGGVYYVYPEQISGVPCFVEGTRILTPDGYKAIETLSPTTDRVLTSDNRAVKFKPFVTNIECADATTAPYIVEANAFGYKNPEQAIRLSPIHKVLVDATKGVWTSPALASKTNPLVTKYGVGQPVKYYHLECENYFTDNIIAEGAVTESYARFMVGWTFNEVLGGYTRPELPSVHSV